MGGGSFVSTLSTDHDGVSVTEHSGDGVIAEVCLEHDHLLLRPALRRTADVSVELEYWTVLEDGRTVVFFGASGSTFGAFETALEEDPTVTDPIVVDQYPQQRVYRVTLTERTLRFVGHTAEVGGRILDITSSRDGWIVQLRFPDRDALVSFNHFCKQREISFHVNHLRLSRQGERAVVGLTAKQEHLLTVAYEEGYFDVPRGISQDELAQKLGVSKSAVSQRLRRAMNELCESSF